MAEINELVSKETLNNVRILEESLGKVVARLNQVAESSEKVDKELMELTNTSKQTSEQQKNLNTKTSEAVKLNKQLQLADDKLVKAKLRFAKATKDQKTELTALINSENKQLGTLDRLIAENKELERQKRKLTSTGAKLRAETLKYNRQIDANSKVIKANRAQSQGLTNTLKGMGKQLLGMATAALGATVIVRGLFNVIKNGFKTTFDFEKSMSEVKAITGAVGDEFDSLRESAIALGGSTAFTASEVAKLQKAYAKLGFTTAEILKITQGTLDLAAATGEDLARSAAIAGATLRGFGLSALEMQRVVDVMAKSFTSSALDLSKFETAMSNVAPVAAATGRSIETASAQLAILADAGLDASKSGTSLRNIYLELEKRGLTWAEASEMINTSVNKASTSLDLFGKRGAVAGIVLASNTEKAEELTLAFEDAEGAAAEMAKINLENVRGQITKLKSAWEGLVLRTNESTGALQGFLAGLTDVVTAINTDGKPALDSLFEEKQIDSFTKRLKFFSDTGAGFISAFATARGTTNKEVQKMQDQATAIGKRRDDLEKRRLADEIELQEAANKIKLDELKAANELIAVENEKRAKNQKEIDDRIAAATAQREKDSLAQRKVFLKVGEDSAKTIRVEGAEETDATLLAKTKINNIDEQELARSNAEIIKDIELEIEQEKLDKIKAIRLDILNAGFDLANALFDRQSQKTEARENMELAMSKTKLESQLNMAGDNAEKRKEIEERFEKQREQIEEKFAKKKAQIQRKQAIADKIASLFNIGLNIAIGISSALKTPVLIPFIAALGAVQLATAIATPIPEFAKGTSKSPDTFIAGEKGRELMIDPTGHMMMANSPTMFTGMKGTKIISNKETETMIGAALTLRSNSQIEGAIREGNREIINTIRNKKEITIFASKKKIVERTGNYFKTYENAKITE